MQRTLDNRSLALSLREMENLQAHKVRMDLLKQTLLSRLSDRPNNEEDLNLSNKEESMTLNSKQTSLQGSTNLSKTSGRGKWPKLRLFTRSCEWHAG